jgi:hypothetical protein
MLECSWLSLPIHLRPMLLTVLFSLLSIPLVLGVSRTTPPAGAIVVRQTGATAGQFTFVIFPCQTTQHLLLYYFFQYHQCGDGLAQRHGTRHGLHISRDLQGASDHHSPILDNNGIYYRVSDYLGSLARCSTVYFVQKHWLLQTKHSHHYG